MMVFSVHDENEENAARVVNARANMLYILCRVITNLLQKDVHLFRKESCSLKLEFVLTAQLSIRTNMCGHSVKKSCCTAT
jgi:hypothetical protein